MSQQDILQTPIEFLKGVGPARVALLKSEINVHTFWDLLHYFPFRHIDRTRFYTTAELNENLGLVQLKGRIVHIGYAGDGRKRRLVATFRDAHGSLELIWFQAVKWVESSLKLGEEYVVFGKPVFYRSGFSIAHPDLELVANAEKMGGQAVLQPVYNSTDKLKNRGLDAKGIAKLTFVLLEQVQQQLLETLPASFIEQQRLLPRALAYRNIHFPRDQNALDAARYRLKFEELFLLQFGLLWQKRARSQKFRGQVFGKVGNNFMTFYEHKLPFTLTEAQKRVLKEIRADLKTGAQMNRLLQGDVGSGKTVVALLTMLLAIDNGFQSCLMAPTEILATQHFHTLRELLGDMDVRIRLLTGSTGTKDRREIHEALKSGELHILVGTHALIEPDVVFQNLGLTIIDEQHRFGVAQRAKLWAKNNIPPHVLVMTATPIPRTLAMTLYGDLDVSVIDELPAGRKPIKTSHARDAQRLKVFEFMRREIQLGRQVYMVYPMIEESEKLDLKYLHDGFEAISRAFPIPQYQVSIVHGKMKSDAKEFEMQRFVKGQTNIMVATTVIEVGVNVPNASVMIIENAERFGLSQLHQLRGRVGRGAEQSYCILMTSDKLSNEAKVRIQTMCETNDGFKIAEVDLQLRGPGDIAGTQQSGRIEFSIADLTTDGEILREARKVVEGLFADDPDLTRPVSRQLVAVYNEQHKHRKHWSRIS